MSGFAHQDLTPVVIGKKTGPRKGGSGSYKSTKSTTDEKIVKKTLDLELKKSIIKARNDMKLTQKDVAGRVGIPIALVKDLENGKLIGSKPMQKILNLLGLGGKKSVVKEVIVKKAE